MCACLRACKRSSVCVQALVYVLRIFNLSCLCASVFVPVHATALMNAFHHIFSSHAQSRTTIENFRQYTIHCTSILFPLPAVSHTELVVYESTHVIFLLSLTCLAGRGHFRQNEKAIATTGDGWDIFIADVGSAVVAIDDAIVEVAKQGGIIQHP